MNMLSTQRQRQTLSAKPRWISQGTRHIATLTYTKQYQLASLRKYFAPLVSQ